MNMNVKRACLSIPWNRGLQMSELWALTWMNRNAERKVELAALWAEIVFRKGDRSWFATWSIVWLDRSLRDQLAPIAEITTMKRFKILKPNFVIVIMQKFRCVLGRQRSQIQDEWEMPELNFKFHSHQHFGEAWSGELLLSKSRWVPRLQDIVDPVLSHSLELPVWFYETIYQAIFI